jgi:predicted phosphohydrolase
MRLAWATDIHLDFITDKNDVGMSCRNLDTFCSLFEESDGIVLSGDISLAPFLKDHLLALEERLSRPIYFVLGNHDFWFSDIASVRDAMTKLSNSSEYLKYLSVVPYVRLTKTVFLIGHDGWCDGLYGDARHSSFVMNDWTSIKDFKSFHTPFNENPINYDSILSVCRQQATIATRHIATGIKTLLSQKRAKKIIIATHVPPFTQPLDIAKSNKQNMYPWYSSKTMGDMLLSAANNNPSIQFEILCGHCHVEYNDRIAPNLLLRSGESKYSQPKPQLTFDVSI